MKPETKDCYDSNFCSISHCSLCRNSECVICDLNFRISIKRECEIDCPDIENCMQCNNQLQCLLCSKGYFLSGIVCLLIKTCLNFDSNALYCKLSNKFTIE